MQVLRANQIAAVTILKVMPRKVYKNRRVEKTSMVYEASEAEPSYKTKHRVKNKSDLEAPLLLLPLTVFMVNTSTVWEIVVTNTDKSFCFH